MDERMQLIERLQDARGSLETALTEVDEETEICPGWTVKELLAHIAGWDQIVVGTLRAHAAGEAPEPLRARGIDEYNAMLVERRQDLSYEQVVEEFQKARAQVVTALRELPTARLFAEMRYPWGGEGTVEEMMSIFVHHEEEHAKELRGTSRSD